VSRVCVIASPEPYGSGEAISFGRSFKMEWICIVILEVAVIVLAIIVGTQKRRFLGPLVEDFYEIYRILGLRFENNQLELTDGADSSFGGLEKIVELKARMDAVFRNLGLEVDKTGAVQVAKNYGLNHQVDNIEGEMTDLANLLGVAWDQNGNMQFTGQGEIDLKGADSILLQLKNLADELKRKGDASVLIATNGELSSLKDKVKEIAPHLDNIRKKAGLFEDFEVLMEKLGITEEQAKTLVEKGYKDMVAIAGKGELEFIKSSGLDLETTLAVYTKVVPPKPEEEKVAVP